MVKKPKREKVVADTYVALHCVVLRAKKKSDLEPKENLYNGRPLPVTFGLPERVLICYSIR